MSEKVLIPRKARVVGGSGTGARKVYISREVYKDIFGFSKDKNICQSGGVLLGNVVEENGCKHVIVRTFIEAKYSEGTSNSITFTKDTWNYIEAEKQKYPEYELVGWMHTNPDTGCKVSEYDMFFQTHMFEGKDIIAYIVDPVQIVEAFYYIEGKRFVKCDGFYVYSDATIPKAVRPKKEQSEKDKKEKFIDEDEFIKLVEEVPKASDVNNMQIKTPDVVGEVATGKPQEDVAEKQQVEDGVPDSQGQEESPIESQTEKEPAVEAQAEKKSAVESRVDKETTGMSREEMTEEIAVESRKTKIKDPIAKRINSFIADDSQKDNEPKVQPDETEAELRMVFEEAEQKVEADKSDLEAFTGKLSDLPERIEDAVVVKTPSSVKAIVAILIVLVIALAVTLSVAVVRITHLEKDISKLYKNDEVLGRYINTGEVGTTAAVVEESIATENAPAETAAVEETKAEGNADGAAEETKAEGNADGTADETKAEGEAAEQ